MRMLCPTSRPSCAADTTGNHTQQCVASREREWLRREPHLVRYYDAIEPHGATKHCGRTQLHVHVGVHTAVEVHDRQARHVHAFHDGAHREDARRDAREGAPHERLDVVVAPHALAQAALRPRAGPRSPPGRGPRREAVHLDAAASAAGWHHPDGRRCDQWKVDRCALCFMSFYGTPSKIGKFQEPGLLGLIRLL
eukprot:15276-Prymnesium_polylepis.2